jgi:hypothetical protein
MMCKQDDAPDPVVCVVEKHLPDQIRQTRLQFGLKIGHPSGNLTMAVEMLLMELTPVP